MGLGGVFEKENEENMACILSLDLTLVGVATPELMLIVGLINVLSVYPDFR